jgi:Flp pilus assembly pilin Flp
MLKLFVMADIARRRLAAMLADQKGVTAMEYGMIAAATVVAVGAVMTTIKGDLTTLFTNLETYL